MGVLRAPLSLDLNLVSVLECSVVHLSAMVQAPQIWQSQVLTRVEIVGH